MAPLLGTLGCSSVLSIHIVVHNHLVPRNLIPFSDLYGYQAYLCRQTCKETHTHTKYIHGGVLVASLVYLVSSKLVRGSLKRKEERKKREREIRGA